MSEGLSPATPERAWYFYLDDLPGLIEELSALKVLLNAKGLLSDKP